jgi:glycosyltransferase involved in cell wall biosynthesis
MIFVKDMLTNNTKNQFKVLHILPHLGGGVGKALWSLCEGATHSCYKHSFLLLEEPNKKQFINKINDLGCDVHITPDINMVDKLILDADIIQLEWWNHPVIFKFFCERNLPEMRLIAWCHVSGLYTPIIPINLVKASQYFLFTSEASYHAENISSLDEKYLSKLGVVSSGIGFSQKNKKIVGVNKDLNFGYMGSLNFSKIHPQFVNYLSKIPIKNFKLKIWGDIFYKEALISQCHDIGYPDLIEFNGYTTEPDKILSDLDVFVYLLNPNHYGTAENVLLEAMSLGVVPIVWNNPAERAIVEQGETGLIVGNLTEFISAVEYLVNHPDDRKRMSINASKQIAEKYSPIIMSQSMSCFYEQLMSHIKLTIDFKSIFGNDPYEWFMACQKDNINDLRESNHPINSVELESTKGSIKHFMNYFPTDTRLNNLFKQLVADV